MKNIYNYIIESQESDNLPEILEFITNILTQYTNSLSDLSEYSKEGFEKWCSDNGIDGIGLDDKSKECFYNICNAALENIDDSEVDIDESLTEIDNIILEKINPSNPSGSKASKKGLSDTMNIIKKEVWKELKFYGRKKATNIAADQINQTTKKIADDIKSKRITVKDGEVAKDCAEIGVNAGQAFSNAGGVGKLIAGVTALSGPQIALITISVAAVAAGTVIAMRQIKKKRNEKLITGVKAKVQEYKKAGNTEKSEFYNEFYKKLKKTCLDENGKPRVNPDTNKLPEGDRELFMSLYNRTVKNKNIIKAGKDLPKKKEVVKDKDGSIIKVRRKKTGHGLTYIRIKDGKEVGYATKDEFRAAKHANESYCWLSDYISESIER